MYIIYHIYNILYIHIYIYIYNFINGNNIGWVHYSELKIHKIRSNQPILFFENPFIKQREGDLWEGESSSSPAPVWSKARATMCDQKHVRTLLKEFFFLVCFVHFWYVFLYNTSSWLLLNFLVYRLNSARTVALSRCLSKRFVLSFVSDLGCVH